MLDRQYGKIIWICDGCADELETDTRDFDEARTALREERWVARQEDGVWVHHCRNCQERHERKG